MVEVIYGERIRKGVRQFHVKWQGYPSSDDDTWEPEENLADREMQRDEAAVKNESASVGCGNRKTKSDWTRALTGPRASH
eukprot:COSAG01_NODE_13735_length_1542_cov_6.726958_2_plen_80_part_00